MKTSEIFIKARTIIYNGRGKYICCTLHSLYTQDEISSETSLRVMSIIMKRLWPESTAETWVSKATGIPVDQIICSFSSEMREWRLKWLEKLIEEFEAKGD